MSLRTQPLTNTEDARIVRSSIYDIFRRIFFIEPDYALLSICKKTEVFAAFPQEDSLGLAAQGMLRLSRYFSSADPVSNTEDLHALRGDFTQLFVGPLAPTAPPWASFYLEDEHLLFQQTTLEIRRMLHNYGFIAGDHINAEADDHIGIELDFLYKLSCHDYGYFDRSAYRSATSALCDQIWLIENHLLKFIPEFRQRIENHAIHNYYPGVAALLESFLRQDLAWLCKQENQQYIVTL